MLAGLEAAPQEEQKEMHDDDQTRAPGVVPSPRGREEEICVTAPTDGSTLNATQPLSEARHAANNSDALNVAVLLARVRELEQQLVEHDRAIEQLVEAVGAVSADYTAAAATVRALEQARDMAMVFKTAATDDTLSDRDVRNVVRFLSCEPLTEADMERTREFAQRFGWAARDAAGGARPADTPLLAAVDAVVATFLAWDQTADLALDHNTIDALHTLCERRPLKGLVP